jgi:hypothetical protein
MDATQRISPPAAGAPVAAAQSPQDPPSAASLAGSSTTAGEWFVHYRRDDEFLCSTCYAAANGDDAACWVKASDYYDAHELERIKCESCGDRRDGSHPRRFVLNYAAIVEHEKARAGLVAWLQFTILCGMIATRYPDRIEVACDVCNEPIVPAPESSTCTGCAVRMVAEMGGAL